MTPHTRLNVHTHHILPHPHTHARARARTHTHTHIHGRAQTEYYRYEKVLKEALNSFAKSVVTRLIEDKDDTVNPEKIPEFNVAFFNLAEQASLNPQSLHLYIHIYIHVYVCVFVCVCVCRHASIHNRQPRP